MVLYIKIIFLGLIIVGYVLLIGWVIPAISSRRNSGINTDSNAIDIIKERYARGEINRQEFESKKKNLSA